MLHFVNQTASRPELLPFLRRMTAYKFGNELRHMFVDLALTSFLGFPVILVSCRKHNVLKESNKGGGRYNVISGLCSKWLLPIGYMNKRSRDKSFFFLIKNLLYSSMTISC